MGKIAKYKKIWVYENCEVLSIIDGDTYLIKVDLGFNIQFTSKVRVKGINCPEKNTKEGVDAMNYVSKIIPIGSFIKINSHAWDKYGRIEAEVFYIKDGNMCDLGLELVTSGYAKTYKD